jgi:hypothetical protein
MPPTDTRVRALASIRLLDPYGAPVLADHGFGWYDILQASHRYGTYSRLTLTREFAVEYVDTIGVVCRPTIVYKDTDSDDFNLSGSWEMRRGATGRRKQRIVQYSAAVGETWSASSKSELPADPHIAIELRRGEAPAGWDHDAAVPYVRVELGDGQWALEWSDDEGGRLLQMDSASGEWIPLRDLPELQTFGAGATAESLVLLRPMRGKILVSTDRGRTYADWPVNDGSVPVIRKGGITFRGQGGVAVFGVHQLKYNAGTYTSRSQNTFTSRSYGPVALLTERSTEPAGTSVVLADDSVPASAIARYTATLTPASTIGPFGWSVYRTPELYAVSFRYAPVLQPWSNTGTWTTPWDGAVWNLDLDKPLELEGTTLRATIRRDTATAFSGNFRWRKVQVRAGWLNSDNTESWWTIFTGYIDTLTVTDTSYAESTIEFGASGHASLFMTAEWTDFDAVPFGGNTINDCLDRILASEGLDTSYRLWHALGNVILPAGLPEDPFEMPRRGERKWETMQRLAGYVGLEVIPLDDGTYLTLPRNVTNGGTAKTWEYVPATDLTALVEGLQFEYRSSEAATLVIVRGELEDGSSAWAWFLDGDAEANPLSGRFSPRRVVVQEEMQGTTTPGMLLFRAQTLADEHFRQKYEPSVAGALDLGIGRRDEVVVQGSTAGISDFDRFVVLTLKHTITGDPSQRDVKTQAGLRRLGF